MKQELLDKIKQLTSFHDEVSKWWDKYIDKIGNVHCDKYDAGFCVDNRHKVFSVGDVWFSSYLGDYGNSRCSTFGGFNDELSRKYFLKTINQMSKEIFERMAKMAKDDANILKEDAQHELDGLQKLLDTVDKDQ